MATTRTILGARLRASWRVLVALAVIGGLTFGASAAAIAVAARTDSGYRRVADRTNAVHYEFTTNGSAGELAELLVAHPDHGLGAVRQWVGFTDVYNSYGVAADSLGPFQPGGSLEDPFVFAGRTPAGVDEILISESLADSGGLTVGDIVQRGIIASDFQSVVDIELEVVGIGAFAAEWGVGDDTQRTPIVLHSLAFVEAHPELVVWNSVGATLDAPPHRAEASRLVESFNERFDGPDLQIEALSVEKERAARLALRSGVTGLVVIGGLGLVAVAAIMAFALRRELDTWTDQRQALRAIGAPLSLRRRIDLAQVLLVLAATTIVAFPTLLIVSAIGPIGEIRRYEPDRALYVDGKATVALVLAMILAGALSLAMGARGSRSAARVPVDDLAIQMIVGTGSVSRRPIGLAVALGVLGIAASAAVVPYVLSLTALIEEPARYGQPWDAMVRTRWGDQSPEDFAEMVASDEVIAAATLTQATFVAGEELNVPTVAYHVAKGPDLMTLVAGRRLAGDREAVMGSETLRQLGLEVGDTVRIRPGPPLGQWSPTPLGDAQATVTIVGSVLFPTLSLPGGAVPRLNQGLAVSRDLFAEIVSPLDLPEVSLFATGSDAAAERLRQRFPEIEDVSVASSGTEWFIGARPAEIRSAAASLDVLWVGLGVLVLASSAVLGLAMRTILRAEQHDIAVLRALGATTKQVRSIAYRQGIALFVPLVVVGVPLGVAGGRLLYSRLARDIGVVATPQTSLFAVIVFVGVLTACSALGVVLASRVTARSAPAISLRAL